MRKNSCFLQAPVREESEKNAFWFTIIDKPHKNRNSYIIVEIMSTNVTTNTRYRDGKGRIYAYFEF